MKVEKVEAGSSLSRGLRDILHTVNTMSDRDKKRFSQCFNCKNLDTCDKDESDENEEGLCKFYDELPHTSLQQQYEFADILTKEIFKEK